MMALDIKERNVRTNSKPLLSIDEAANELGLKPSTLRAWLIRRKLPRVNCGRAVRIPAAAIAEFIERNTIPSLGDDSRNGVAA